MKSLIRKIIPKSAIATYHKTLTALAAVRFGFPSRKMIVIGVTGTNGKSTTVHLISHLLEGTGHKTGYTTTVDFKVGDRRWLNKYKMTMLGRTALQGMLSQMAQDNTHYAIIETSSEGLIQNRNTGIDYDVAVFTNLTPEHIESHGSFENYKKAKGLLFSSLKKSIKKNLDWSGSVKKCIVANTDDSASDYYLSFWSEKKIGFGKNTNEKQLDEKVVADNIVLGSDGSSFSVQGVQYKTQLLGLHNVYNILAAIAVGRSQGISHAQMSAILPDIQGVPGRMEWINEGQQFKVLIDYAPEPASLDACYKTINDLMRPEIKRVIHILGSAGGGRDTSRRPILGDMSARNADIVIVTNEDPYDEDPVTIIDQVASGATRAGKEEGKDLFKILDRREAIIKAFSMANPGDLVLLTGKGAEQAICLANGGKIEWDERDVAREVLRSLLRGQK